MARFVSALFFPLCATGMVQLRGSSTSGSSKVRVGQSFSLVLDELTNQVMAMGRNSYGQLGNGDTNDTQIPTEVILPEGVVSDMAAGSHHSLFVVDGKAYGCGRNYFGQLVPISENSSAFYATPQLLMDGVTAVAAGHGHSLFLLSDGTVLARGWNANGQLGTEHKSHLASEESILEFNGTVTAVAAGWDFSFFAVGELGLFATGQNLAGQLGDGTKVTKYMPTLVGPPVQAIAAGETHALFIANDEVYATGANFDLQLGIVHDSTGNPERITGLPAKAERIFAGGDSSVAIFGDGSVWQAGSNRLGQLGLGNVSKLTWAKRDDATAVEDQCVGASHSLVSLRYADRREVKGAGSNMLFELGLPEQSLYTSWQLASVPLAPLPTMAPTPAPAPTPTEAPPAPTGAPTTGAPSAAPTTPAPGGTREPNSNPGGLIPGMDDTTAVAVLAGGFVCLLIAFAVCRKREPVPDPGAQELTTQDQVEPTISM